MAAHEIALAASESLAGGRARERSLVDDCRRGDPQAFARLVGLHETMVFNLACRLLGDAEEARDAAQEVFLQVYRTLGRFEGRSSLRTWIYRIVVNHCQNRRRFWRRRRRDRSVRLDELSAADERRLADHGAETPERALARREEERWVQAALLALPFRHRAVLVLREVEGLSCAEIADALVIAEGTVKSRLSRGREALRRRLRERGAGE
jgi:RNA polymerase sigma-70 factor (ECF subfamily)